MKGFSTRSIHDGQSPDPTTGAVITPIFQTSTYVHESLGKHRGYEYARTQNPTREALERNVASLEGATHGVAFASGMAAISAIMTLTRAGDHVICSYNVYGGTYRLFERVLADYGLLFTYVNTSNPEQVRKAMTRRTKVLFIETPTNPLLGLTDIREIARMKKPGTWLVVDNTFMTPYFQRPLELGADIVIHSSTKYLNGHSDVVGGIVLTGSDEAHERIRFVQNAVGAVPGPFDCWLVLRGTKTLALRMREHEANANAIAGFLDTHPAVKNVYYPGLPSHPGHALAKMQMRGFGAMITIELGNYKRAKKFLDNVRIFSLAESLGGVESLISHPATMTHASVPEALRKKIGITEGLVRLSVGVEDLDDLREDLALALGKVK
jgi:cystathionine beta-lyase/cystathionine gamma-synthase